MNTTTTRRPVSIVIATTAVASVLAGTIIGTAGTANASESRDQARVGSVPTSGSYADPLAALDGDTMAQYLSDHWARVINPGV